MNHDDRICSTCEVEKPSSEFYANRQQCKSCLAERQRAYRTANPARGSTNKAEYDRIGKLKYQYNMMPEEYLAMLDTQNGTCAICHGDQTHRGTPTRFPFAIDHDHNCCAGKGSCGQCIRGLLCDKCNKALGLFNDDIDRLISAAFYLLQNSPALNHYST